MSTVTDETDRERNRRLFGGFIGWLMFEGRRPGMFGAAVSFAGTTRLGKAAVQRVGPRWQVTEPGSTREVSTADVLKMVGEGAFFPRTVDVVPDLAQLLFMEAVNQAEASHGHVLEAARYVGELTADQRQNVMPWVLGTSELDRAVRASIASIVLAVAAAEAQVNRWAEVSGGWHGVEDKQSLVEKCQTLAERAGQSISPGAAPYQDLGLAAQRRNTLVHSKPTPETLKVTGAGAPMPGRSATLGSRAACLAVRQSMIDLARRLSVDLPPYLAYCPSERPDDDEAWRAASFRTGIRADPDYPHTEPDTADQGDPPARPEAPSSQSTPQ